MNTNVPLEWTPYAREQIAAGQTEFAVDWNMMITAPNTVNIQAWDSRSVRIVAELRGFVLIPGVALRFPRTLSVK